jgi:hypothetical protein
VKTFADNVIEFNRGLEFRGTLPEGIRIMNPFRESDSASEASAAFYKKFYNDNHSRHLILGINPGRFGAGLTGIPFTDPKRLVTECGITYRGTPAHEPSSAFIYEMISAYGGVQKFYREFFIHAICPLGFTSKNEKGREVNYNYYDSKELLSSVYDFIVQNIKTQLSFGIKNRVCICLGRGKNEKFLQKLNKEHGFFDEIIPLEHPRFIMQYKSNSKQLYMEKYIAAFDRVINY